MKPLQCARATVLLTLLLGVCYAQDEPQHRIYDVRDLVRIENGFLPTTALEASFVPSRAELQDEPSPAVQISDLTAMVQASTSMDYWEQDGVEIRAEDGGFLSVVCNDDMHQTIGQILGKLRKLLFEPVLVEVHELRGVAIDRLGSVLSAEAAETLLAQAGEHRVHFGRANVRKPLLLESKRIQNRITAMDVRIADNAVAPRPRIETDSLGASWTVQTMRTVGDTILVTVSGSDRALEPTPITRQMPSSDGNNTVSLELHATRIMTCHASAHLQAGQAMLVGSNADDGGLLCVRVHRLSQANNAVIGELTAYPIAALVRGATGPIDVRMPFSDALLFPPIATESQPTIVDDGRLMECIMSEVAPNNWDGAPNTMNYMDGQLFIHADQAVQADVAKKLREFHALDARQFSLEVRFGEVNAATVRALRVTEPDQLAATLPQYCLSTVSASRGAQVSATRHMPFIRNYDSTVASNSTAIMPVVDSFAEGFLLRGKVAAMTSESVMLDLHLTLLSGNSKHDTFELGHPRIGAIDKVDVRESKVRGNTAIALGKWTLVHLAPIEGGNAHIAVVARVQPL